MPKYKSAYKLSLKIGVDDSAVIKRIHGLNKRQPGTIKKKGGVWAIPDEIAKRWIAEREAARAFNPKEDITQRAFIFNVLKLKSTLGKGTYKMKILETIPWEKAILPNGMVANVLPKGHAALRRVEGIFGELKRIDGEYFTSGQLAKELGVHPKSVGIWRMHDKLQPAIEIAGKHYYPRDLPTGRKEEWLGRVRGAERKHREYKTGRAALRLKLVGLEEKLVKKHKPIDGALVEDFVGLLETGVRLFGKELTPAKARRFALRAKGAEDIREWRNALHKELNAPFPFKGSNGLKKAIEIRKRYLGIINRVVGANIKRR